MAGGIDRCFGGETGLCFSTSARFQLSKEASALLASDPVTAMLFAFEDAASLQGLGHHQFPAKEPETAFGALFEHDSTGLSRRA